MTDRELMQQALDALISTVRLAGEWGVYLMRRDEDEGHAYRTIEAIRARLAQSEPPCKTGSQCIGGKCPQCVVNELEFTQHVENDDGWCDWTYPRHKDYRMKCCDCGLVHEVQFQVLGEISPQPDGSNDGVLLDDLECQVGMRMRRVKSQPEPERCKHGVWAADHCYECEKEPEPVAWMNHEGTGALCVAGGMDIPDWKHLFPTPLYTAPPQRQWVGLTDDEIRWMPKGGTFYDFARAIEQALKEKNHG